YAGWRCGRARSACAAPGILWLLRLAFGCARALAAGAPGAAVSGRALRGASTARTRRQPHTAEYRRRVGISQAPGPCVIRAALWPRVAAAIVGGTAHL